MILIGSRALALRVPKLLIRNPVDFDFVCSKDEFNIWMEKNYNKINPSKIYELPEYHKMIVEGPINCEFEIVTPNSSSELLKTLVESESDTFETELFGKVPSINILFAIKNSHKYKKFNNSAAKFWKTALDWHLLKQIGASIKPEYSEFSKLREQESYAAQKYPKLNVNKDAFFKDDNINYIYDHDDIHKAVALYDKPAYLYYIEDNEEVKCSKKKFFEVPESIRLAGVYEEACVLALERSLIAHPGAWSPDLAFKFALAKVCTTITSGYFRQFAFENVFKVLELYKNNLNYFEKFNKAVSENKVKHFSGSKY